MAAPENERFYFIHIFWSTWQNLINLVCNVMFSIMGDVEYCLLLQTFHVCFSYQKLKHQWKIYRGSGFLSCRSAGGRWLPLIAMFIGLIWGPSGADRTQVGPMLALWTLLSGTLLNYSTTRWISGYSIWSLIVLRIFAMNRCFSHWKIDHMNYIGVSRAASFP